MVLHTYNGRQQDFIANTYKDGVNGIAIDDLLPTEFEEIGEFIQDEAHLANEVIQSEPELPDSPTL